MTPEQREHLSNCLGAYDAIQSKVQMFDDWLDKLTKYGINGISIYFVGNSASFCTTADERAEMLGLLVQWVSRKREQALNAQKMLPLPRFET